VTIIPLKDKDARTLRILLKLANTWLSNYERIRSTVDPQYLKEWDSSFTSEVAEMKRKKREYEKELKRRGLTLN
jgi:hypothetical protein